MRTITIPLLLSIGLGLAGCQSLVGEREGDYYHSPAGAYSIDLGINTFRGEVTLDERCDRHGGSTTFWDGAGRMFRADYLRIEDHPLIDPPRFAADMTLLNLVLNTYLREIIAPSDLVTSVSAAHREFLQETEPRSLFAIVGLEVDHEQVVGTPPVSGRHYYGMLLFQRGEKIYILQHRQPVLMPEQMRSVLLRMADAVEIPGKERGDTDIERLRRVISRMAPGDDRPVRLCDTG